ncbi:hypothetical protein RIF29_38466 [Crotalaria pallida]|uniref:Reverse transcriptase zinc-binding domain-containing protein n=1 Tax=Crotalaria pallida TaxID=3830 RepID=A0AAN9DZC7_CROPI
MDKKYPRCKDLAWRACKNIIPVKEHLAFRGMDIDKTYSLCGEMDETMTHALLLCKRVQPIWFAYPLSIQFNQGVIQDFAIWLSSTVHHDKISKFVLQQVLDVHAYEARQRDYALKGHKHFYFMTLNGNEMPVQKETWGDSSIIVVILIVGQKRLIGTTEKEKESYMNPVSAISKIHTLVEVQDSKGKLPSSVQLEDFSQQNAMESDLVQKPSSIPRSETASLITESKVLKNSINTNRESKTERVEGGRGVSRSNLLV